MTVSECLWCDDFDRSCAGYKMCTTNIRSCIGAVRKGCRQRPNRPNPRRQRQRLKAPPAAVRSRRRPGHDKRKIASFFFPAALQRCPFRAGIRRNRLQTEATQLKPRYSKPRRRRPLPKPINRPPPGTLRVYTTRTTGIINKSQRQESRRVYFGKENQ